MSDFISRRSFLKGGMTGAAGLAALGMLSGCSGSSQAAASGSAAGAATGTRLLPHCSTPVPTPASRAARLPAWKSAVPSARPH